MPVLFAITVIVVLGVFGLVDLVNPRRTIRLASRYVAQLPAGETEINEEGRRRLSLALILLAQAIEANELLEKSDAAARALLSTVTTEPAARLLAEAGALLFQIETEDNVFTQIRDTRKRQLTAWLDEYLNRRTR